MSAAARHRSLPVRKRIAQWAKARLYAQPRLDSAIDRALCPREEPPSARTTWLRQHLLYRLFPEREGRTRFPLSPPPAGPTTGLVRVLALTPPEDTGGGSRPAQIAAELHRRGYALDWTWALPAFPWPQRDRPRAERVEARHLSEAPGDHAGDAADLVLLSAPHPALFELAHSQPRRGPLVYDAIDQWDSSLGRGWFDAATEHRVEREADLLVASAASLRDATAERSGRTVELLPNAVDLERFDSSTTPSPTLAPGSPTIVYVGALWGDWVDLDFVAELATALPDATVHLVGPSGSRKVPKAPNLFAHGPRPHQEIPALLAAADVALIPFTRDRLTEGVSPLKVFEYLAMDVPVVSTPLPEVRGVPGVRLAEGTGAFADEVTRAAREPFPRDAVAPFLRQHTWRKRVDRLLELTRDVR